jgi:uncharacterized coiled-coil DUF342 family protein
MMGFLDNLLKFAEAINEIANTVEGVSKAGRQTVDRYYEAKARYHEIKSDFTEIRNNRPENRARAANERRQICMINLKNGHLSGKDYSEAMKEMEDDLRHYDTVLKGPRRTLPDELFKKAGL